MAEKRRKSTCTKRKEEIGDLKAEIRKLRSELEVKAELKGLEAPVKRGKSPPFESEVLENETMASVIQQQQLEIARVHSTLPPPLTLHPLCTRICLKKSWADRSQTLLDLREHKFRAASIYNARMVSTNDMDITTEVSGIMFSRFFEAADDNVVAAPCGMLVLDSVDEDELYPYVSSERVRKDVSAAFVLTADRLEAKKDDDLVVTLRRAAFVKLHRPEFDISEAAWLELQQDVVRWGDVTNQAIRSVLYSVP
ncbi:hypothetical protein PRIC2_005386 [Phytophthora ramorum]